MNIPFDAFFARLAKETDINTQTALADALAVIRKPGARLLDDAEDLRWIEEPVRLDLAIDEEADVLDHGRGDPREVEGGPAHLGGHGEVDGTLG